MISTCISQTQVPKASALYTDYLYQFDRVAGFYSGSPLELASYREMARQVAPLYPERPHREALFRILERQNRAFGCGEETLANIRSLRQADTMAVVTGQQVGLFSGPAFTLYKALTAVRLAAHLSDHGLRCVPVFWLATEDHDLEEVSSASVLSDSGELVPVSASGNQPAANSSVGRVKFSDDVTAALSRIEEVLPAGEARDRLMADLRETYAPGAGWGVAFGRFIARLFSRFGVVLLDPLDKEVHELTRPAMERALRKAQPLRDLLDARSRELVRAGYHAQVHVGEDSTLLFATQEGSRIALRQHGEEFLLDEDPGKGKPQLQQRMSQVEEWLAREPLDFTPSALLRPITQDSILPTVAYIAGPAELAYFGQAQAIYPEFGRPAPVVFPRAGFTLAERREQRLMEKYDLNVDDIWQGEEHLRRKIAASAGAEEQEAWPGLLDRGGEEITRTLEALQIEVKRLDPTLVDSVSRAQEKMAHQLERLRGKISRAAVERSALLSRHEQEISRFILPRGNLQEREVSGIYFLGRAGYALLDSVLDRIQPHCLDHQFLVY